MLVLGFVLALDFDLVVDVQFEDFAGAATLLQLLLLEDLVVQVVEFVLAGAVHSLYLVVQGKDGAVGLLQEDSWLDLLLLSAVIVLACSLFFFGDANVVLVLILEVCCFQRVTSLVELAFDFFVHQGGLTFLSCR